MSTMRWIGWSAVLLLGCAHQSTTAPKVTAAPPPSATSSEVVAAPAVASNTEANLQMCDAVRVHFAFDSSLINEAEQPALQRAADCLQKDARLHVMIEGNADERGTVEYNIALGQRRADAVAEYLQRLGVPLARVRTISYGKERPECTVHNEDCWAQNRRAAVNPLVR
jgi:peptidoglycan-associated lipoprotein